MANQIHIANYERSMNASLPCSDSISEPTRSFRFYAWSREQRYIEDTGGLKP